MSDEGGVLTNIIWSVQMPGFMLVSGYFSSRIIVKMKDVTVRISLSLQHYAIPFLSWFIMINTLVLGQYSRNPISGLRELFSHIDIGLWFLWVIFILSIIATFANYALSCNKNRIIKFIVVIMISFGLLLAAAKVFGLNFIGIKYILYYSVFYGFGWMVKRTERWWKRFWPLISNIVIGLCFFVFIAIIFNYDLYNAKDNLIGISMRCISGFTGNVVLLMICQKYKSILSRAKIDTIGMYTLEIYATHMYVNNLMEMQGSFFTLSGFGVFVSSLVLTTVFTAIIIVTIKTIPLTDFVFFGKNKNEKALRKEIMK